MIAIASFSFFVLFFLPIKDFALFNLIILNLHYCFKLIGIQNVSELQILILNNRIVGEICISQFVFGKNFKKLFTINLMLFLECRHAWYIKILRLRHISDICFPY